LWIKKGKVIYVAGVIPKDQNEKVELKLPVLRVEGGFLFNKKN